MALIDDIQAIYQSQLGRAADQGGLDFYTGLANSGMSLDEIARQINVSTEGQNYDTQTITDAYRDSFARNPEQAGYQYYASAAQADPTITASDLVQMIIDGAAASGEAITNAGAGVPALEADPYGGRYGTSSIYDVTSSTPNVSSINGTNVAFVTPVGQMPVVSSYLNGDYTSAAGQYVLNPEQANAQIELARSTGALSDGQFNQLMSDLAGATTVDQVMNAFNTPTAKAQSTVNPDLLNNAYSGVSTTPTNSMVTNQDNLGNQMTNLLQSLYKNFGGEDSIQTPMSNLFYGENGLASYTPLGSTNSPIFRSGVAGYTSNLPGRFDFGVPTVSNAFPVYQPQSFAPYQAIIDKQLDGSIKNTQATDLYSYDG
jgi:hypothetical protein